MKKKYIIFDLDNTLYNWVDTIIPAIRVMVESCAAITKIDIDQIYSDLQKVNQKYGTVEHPNSLLEAQCIRRWSGSKQDLDAAFYEFNRYRKLNTVLYEGVDSTLNYLNLSGYGLVLLTDAQVFAAADRIDRLELGQYFDHIYCVASSGAGLDFQLDPWIYGKLKGLQTKLINKQDVKPNPKLIGRILNDLSLQEKDVFYVGDSLFKDISMANASNIRSVWAKYGTSHKKVNMETLFKISHWSDGEIKQQQDFIQRKIAIPDVVLHEGLHEILNFLDTPHQAMRA